MRNQNKLIEYRKTLFHFLLMTIFALVRKFKSGTENNNCRNKRSFEHHLNAKVNITNCKVVSKMIY